MLPELGVRGDGTPLICATSNRVAFRTRIGIRDRRASCPDRGPKEMQRAEPRCPLHGLVAPCPERRSAALREIVWPRRAAHWEIGVRLLADHENPSPYWSAGPVIGKERV